MNAKQRFLQSAFRDEWEKIALGLAFRAACDYALLVMIEGQSRAMNLNEGWDQNSQLIGARNVLEILSNLPIQSAKVAPLRGPELNYDVPNTTKTTLK